MDELGLVGTQEASRLEDVTIGIPAILTWPFPQPILQEWMRSILLQTPKPMISAIHIRCHPFS